MKIYVLILTYCISNIGCYGNAINESPDEIFNQMQCKLRGGREILVKVNFGDQSEPLELGNNIFYLQSVNVKSGRIKNHKRCFKFDSSIWCLTWNILSHPKKIRKEYRFRTINSKNGKVIWEDQHTYIPKHHLFFCIPHSLHTLRQMKITKTDIGGIMLSWSRSYWDNKFSPIHHVIWNQEKTGQLLKQDDCSLFKCTLNLQKPIGTCVRGTQNVCIETRFDLKDGKNIYSGKHAVTTCTSYEEQCNESKAMISGSKVQETTDNSFIPSA